MYYNRLGKTGLQVSAISLGSYLTFGHHVDVNAANELMDMAYHSGVNCFDTAEIYALGRAEEIIGECLKKLKWPRDTYIIGSKVFWGGAAPTQVGLNRKHIVECCHHSLKKLNVEYLDFFLCHRYDVTVSVEDVVVTMNKLIQQGKILYWGTSEWSAYHILKAYMIAKEYKLIPPAIEQFQYNMLERMKAEKEFIYLFKDMELGVMSTMPLASGLLTGKYNDGIPKNSRFNRIQGPFLKEVMEKKMKQETIEKIKKLKIISSDLSITLSQLAIAWCLKNPHMSTVIIGASSVNQLQENINTVELIHKIDQSTLENIELILENKPEIGANAYSYEEILPYV